MMQNRPVAEFPRLALKKLDSPASASIIDVQHLASYNWIEAPEAIPTIAVPGSPDLWSPPKGSFRLDKDSGQVYIAQNAARHPDSPLEPLFRSLYVLNPCFNIAAVDVVTDRNNIRKLLGFINPQWSGNKKEDFTIHVEAIQNTIILRREETKTVEYIGPNEFRGYGHSFEKKCLHSQINGSTGHHRVTSYNFGNLKFVVRYETDGYVGGNGAKVSQQTAGIQASTVDDLSSVLDSLSLSSVSSDLGKPASAGSKLVVRKEGQMALPNSILEVKTRVARRPLAFEDVVSQLWASQTPKLVRAYHNNGVFAKFDVEDVAAQVKAWEDKNQDDLRMLAGLIGKIREIVKEGGGRSILKYRADGDKLVFCELGGKQMLPKDLYTKWEGHDNLRIGTDVKTTGKSGKQDRIPVSGKTLRPAVVERSTVGKV